MPLVAAEIVKIFVDSLYVKLITDCDTSDPVIASFTETLVDVLDSMYQCTLPIVCTKPNISIVNDESRLNLIDTDLELLTTNELIISFRSITLLHTKS